MVIHVDVFLIDQAGKELNMGTRYDYMDELSHLTVAANRIGEEAYHNRKILQQAMEKFGFHSYVTKFWHYSYAGKTDRKTVAPLDIEITPDKKYVGAVIDSRNNH
jgi:D-alanyl-D-alanine dipeptidase